MSKAKFLLSKSKTLKQYNEIKKLADQVSYSLKTNFEVGQLLEENTDCYFSIHTKQNLDLIKDKSRVWFFAQGWTTEEVKKLLDLSVNKFVVDNEPDLNILLENLDDKIDLLLRMKLRENTIHTGKHYVFGMYAHQVNKLVSELRKHKNIGKLGIHFHRKTQNISEWSLKYEVKEALSEETLNNIDILNIGGGIPSKYKNFRIEVMNHIFENIKELKDWINKRKITMIVEPGRFIAAPAVKLETEIVNIYDNNIIVNSSVYNSAMDTFVAHIRLLIDGELENESAGRRYTIKGITPDSMDIFRYSVFLLNKKVGDKIIFLNAGAYNFSTNFCNLEKIDTIILD